MTPGEMNPAAGLHERVASLVALGVLALLLVVDLTFLCGHIWLAPFNAMWNIEADSSYAEQFQHLKWLGACLLALALALRRRVAVYFAWAAIFFYFLVDDSVLVHERVGAFFVAELGLDRIQQVYIAWFPNLFLRPQDFGELVVALMVTAVIAVLLVLSWPLHAAVRERTVMKHLIAWLGLLAFFAIGVDMLHIMAMPVSASATYALGVIEDGGEMVCASLLVGALELARAAERPPGPIRIT